MILENKPGASLTSEGHDYAKDDSINAWKDAWNRHVTSLYKFIPKSAGDKSVEHILNVCAGNTKTIVQNSFTHVFQRWLVDCEPTQEDTKVAIDDAKSCGFIVYGSKEERAFAAKQKAAKEWVRSMHTNEGAAVEKSTSKKNLNEAWKLMLRWTNKIQTKMKDAAEKNKQCAKILPGSLWKWTGASPLLLDTNMLSALADGMLSQEWSDARAKDSVIAFEEDEEPPRTHLPTAKHNNPDDPMLNPAVRRVWSLFFDLEKLQDLRPHSALGKSVSTDVVGLHVRFQRECGRNLKAKEQRAKAWLLLRPLLENVCRAGNLLLKAAKKHKKSPSAETYGEKTRLTAIFEAAKKTLSNHYAVVKDTEKEYPQLDLMELLPGKPYTSFKKKLANYENLFTKACRITFRCVDPGVRSIATWVDFFTGLDVRTTMGEITAAWYEDTVRSKQRAKWSTAHVRKVLGEDLYDQIVKAGKDRGESKIDHVEYSSLILESLPALKTLRCSRALRRKKLWGHMLRQKALDIMADKICTPRDGDDFVFLICGNAAKSKTFGRGIKGHAKSPAKAVFEHILATRRAVFVWASEFRTSALAPDSHIARHPLERQQHRLFRKKKNRTSKCTEDGCDEQSSVTSAKCDKHAKSKPRRVHGVVIDGSHRALNRDVAGAISIGAMFFAQILGLDLGRWQRHVIAEDTTLRGWNEIFDAHGLSCPFYLPECRPPKSAEKNSSTQDAAEDHGRTRKRRKIVRA